MRPCCAQRRSVRSDGGVFPASIAACRNPSLPISPRNCLTDTFEVRPDRPLLVSWDFATPAAAAEATLTFMPSSPVVFCGIDFDRGLGRCSAIYSPSSSVSVSVS